jgi:ribulose 1,5-bisphosphate carboxylase large subunit-like protein
MKSSSPRWRLRLITELSVVFVGVIMAIGAKNWISGQAARAEASAGLEIVLDDLAIDSAAFVRTQDRIRNGSRALEWLLQSRERADPPLDSV